MLAERVAGVGGLGYRHGVRCLYRSGDPFFIGHLQLVLGRHGFACFVKNAFLIGAAGELPPTECLPELWIEDDADFARAQELLRGLLNEGEAGESPWRCRGCGESIEPQFAECWNCGAGAPA